MSTLVDREVAEKAVTSWLDKKKILVGEREKKQTYIDQMIDSVMEGILVLNPETFEFTHDLSFPIRNDDGKGTGAIEYDKLKYASRLNDKTRIGFAQGVKADDPDGQLTATIAALTKTPRAIISMLDSQDKKLSMAIAVFFH